MIYFIKAITMYVGSIWLLDWHVRFSWNGTIAPQNIIFRSFEEARKFTHSLNLKSKTYWAKKSNLEYLPLDIPHKPDLVYKDKEWKGWGDWLWTGSVATINIKFRSFKDSREFAKTLGLKTAKDWEKYSKSGKKPDDIPSNPHRSYSKERLRRRK